MIYKLIGFFFLIVSCSEASDSNTIHIAVASSLQPVMQEITMEFEKESQRKVHLITASSGKLSAQLEAGAPYDLFFSADTFYTNYLQKKLYLPTPPKTFALGKLALVSLIPIPNTNSEFDNNIEKNTESELGEVLRHFLQKKSIHKIAIPNPKLAPYGKAAVSLLHHLNLKEVVQPKLVFSESVSQSNQFIGAKTVDVTFTSQSSIPLFSDDKRNSFYLLPLPKDLYKPIKNSYVVVYQNNIELTQQFLAFFHSSKVKSILEKYAYDVI